MADFPTVGISEEELEKEILKQIKEYIEALDIVNLYGDVEEDLLRMSYQGRASQLSIDCTVGNIIEYYKNTRNVSLIRERISVLYDLSKKFFPDLALVILENNKEKDSSVTTLEDLLAGMRNADDKNYDKLLRRLSANFKFLLERYYGEKQSEK